MKKRTPRGRKPAVSPVDDVVHSTSHYRVFISHATLDKFIAKAICRYIEEAGVHAERPIQTQRDDDFIEGGERIPERIKAEILACDELIVLLTPASLDRQWIILEIGMAFAHDKRIVPILYHVDAERIPDIIGDHRGFDLDRFEDYLDDLTRRIRRDLP